MKMELLAPAGTSSAFLSAIDYGADAIYLGIEKFNARNKAENFTLDNLGYYINYAHMFNVKVYLTLNTLIKDEEILDFLETAKAVYNLGIDAVIIQDIGMSALLKKYLPDLTIHLSTQMAVSNYNSALALKEAFNAKRVVLSRECTKEEIERVNSIPGLETEVFVHGALCVALSGYCYFSSLVFSNSGNRGMCLQPCRKKYTCEMDNSLKSGYFLSTKDICLLNDIKSLQMKGVTSLKIEGRLKSSEYVAGVVKAYRKAIDGENMTNKDIEELKLLYNRGDFSTGYVFSNKNIIYNKLQGHKGVLAGEILKVKDNTAEIKANRHLNKEDGFKVTREDKEVGGIEIIKPLFNNKYLVKTFGKIAKNDNVYITKDTSLLNSLNKPHKKVDVTVDFYAKLNEYPYVIVGLKDRQYECKIDFLLENSLNCMLKKEEVISSFNKVDNLPFNVKVNHIEIDEVFLPKSKLNELRRKALNGVFAVFTNTQNTDFTYESEKNIKKQVQNLKKSVIIENAGVLSKQVNSKIEHLIYRPNTYNKENIEYLLTKAKDVENIYLYIPEYIEKKDYVLIESLLKDNNIGLALNSFNMLDFALNNKRKIFALNLNVFNIESVRFLESLGILNIALSKELNKNEIMNIVSNTDANIYINAFGEIDLMYLKHCPLRENFNSTCDKCKYAGEFIYKDEKGINFKIRRIKLNNCYFSLKNSRFLNILKENKFQNLIYNLSSLNKEEVENLLLNNIVPNREYTVGSYIKGVK